MKRAGGERIDKILFERGLAASRTRAQALVMAGAVLVDEQRVEKSSDTFPVDANVRVRGADDPAARYVGRGGVKLEAALREFRIDPQGWTCLDIGASTGGFTDCLLQHGARRVVAIDAGHNQIDWRLRTDERVEVREGTNARHMLPEDFPADIDGERRGFPLVVMDVSFISATKVLPALVPLVAEGGLVVVLVKPQFEVGRGEVGKGGVVKDPEKHRRVVDEVNICARLLGLRVRGVVDSPITGQDGNREFLACYELSAEDRGDTTADAAALSADDGTETR